MRTQVGDYATIYYPEQYIYSEDMCNVFVKATSADVSKFDIILRYDTSMPATDDFVYTTITLTPDADGNSFVDISPYNRSMVWECGKTLARLTVTIQVTVLGADDSTLDIKYNTCTLEPGTGRFMFTSNVAGEAVQPPKEVPILNDNISLLFDLQDTGVDGQLTGCKAGGTWAAWATILEQTGVDPQIKRYADCTVLPSFADMQAKALNHELATVWQGRIFSVAEACTRDKWAWVEWRADQWLNKKSWLFKIKQVTRKVTEAQDLALQPFTYSTTAYYNTMAVNERNGLGINRQKNWQVSMQGVVDGLTEREMMYFQDLFTSPEVRVKADALGRYGDSYLTGIQAAVDGSSITTAFKAERGLLTFTLLVADFKTF